MPWKVCYNLGEKDCHYDARRLRSQLSHIACKLKQEDSRKKWKLITPLNAQTSLSLSLHIFSH